MDPVDETTDIIKNKLPKIKTLVYLLLIVCGVFIFISLLLSAPFGNKVTTIHISEGQSLNSIVNNLEAQRVVKSSFLLKTFIVLFKSDRQITKGDYLFDKNQSVFKIAWQIARGIHNIAPIKITFKEGITNEEIATILADKLPSFRRDLFLTNIDTKQGYLFPDTYFFFPLTTTDEVINDLSTNFKKKISMLNSDIISSGKNLSDIITMASILEKEAKGKDDPAIISGILWNRLNKGMLLQVDAVPSTYKTKGLPESPIDNPGIYTINASIKPTSTSYLFYLHDKNGVAHFAKTYQEHKLNINRYLK
jgi:UPF0755 protein